MLYDEYKIISKVKFKDHARNQSVGSTIKGFEHTLGSTSHQS